MVGVAARGFFLVEAVPPGAAWFACSAFLPANPPYAQTRPGLPGEVGSAPTRRDPGGRVREHGDQRQGVQPSAIGKRRSFAWLARGAFGVAAAA